MLWIRRMHSITKLQATPFQDQFGRYKRKLRISVTDRCNFKCVYCMPEHPEWMHKHNLLSFEALYAFCKFMVQRGIEQIRITGGEPLMRQGVVHFVQQLQALRTLGLKRISMTTNGHYLKQYAQALKQAGLDDLNISLDSLDATQFQQLTQRKLAPVLEGIAEAKKVGLKLKINTVLMQSFNSNQIIPLVQWALQQHVELRFIEFMPLDGDKKWTQQEVVSEQYILEILSSQFNVQILEGQGAQPARQYLVNGQALGIISTITNSFCGRCDRLRLNAQGEFYNCLFSLQGLNIKQDIEALSFYPQQNGTLLNSKLASFIWQKEQGFHSLMAQNQSSGLRKISMHMIGG